MKRVFVLLFIILLAGCSKNEIQERYFYDEMIMNTIFEIIVYSAEDQNTIEKTVNGAFGIARDMENKYSVMITNSMIYELNHRTNDSVVIADDELKMLLRNSLSLSKKTKGAFDITIEPLNHLWGFYVEEDFHLPSEDEISNTLETVGYSRLSNTSKGYMINTNIHIDLGGMLKGYAVDCMVDYLISNGIKSGIVNAGGNLKVFGNKPANASEKNPKWVIGIKHPRDLNEIYNTVLLSRDKSISTSGDYEKYFITNGVRYHHILNPATGCPARNGLVSVSVVMVKAVDADMLSTSLFVMGLNKGIEYADKNHIPALFITETNGTLSEKSSIYWSYNN